MNKIALRINVGADDQPKDRLMLVVHYIFELEILRYCSVLISLESQERSKIVIVLEKSLYSAKRLTIWHRDVNS